MIIKLDEAQKVDPEVTQVDLDAYEAMVRQRTNNNFQDVKVRYYSLHIEPSRIVLLGRPDGLRAGDTIQVSGTNYNNGLYTVSTLGEDNVSLQETDLYPEGAPWGMLTKVKYPADIRQGVLELIRYRHEMAGKLGIKSESIARMSTTYYDVNAADNAEGFPAAKLDFLKKYEKMRWG